MKETKAYLALKNDVKNLIKDKDRFNTHKIKIFPKQMSVGKSHLQGKDLPQILLQSYPDLKYIFRICPTNEVAGDGTFENVEEPFRDLVLPKFSADYKGQREFENYLKNLDSQKIFCLSFTHQLFNVWSKNGKFETLIEKIKNKAVLIIEEAHQFVGCGDEGRDAYQYTSGYASPYSAETAKRILQWAKLNGKVIGFTATPTKHHNQEINTTYKYTEMYEVVGELAPLEDLIGAQAWLRKEKSYNLQKYNPVPSVTPSVEEAINSLFSRENQLRELKEKDPNIKTKLTGLFTCGTKSGVWGTPIHSSYGAKKKNGTPLPEKGMVEIISNHLRELGYDESTQMIATLQEEGSGGNRIWDLSDNPSHCESVQTFEEVLLRLLDENDELRYLIVVNRARSGISVNNLGAMVVGGIREPQFIRENIPVQVYGRMARLNAGTGTRIMTQYYNNLENYIETYPLHNPHVTLNTIVDTILVSNYFDVWYPRSTDGKDTTETWRDSMTSLKKYYVNNFEDGKEWLQELSGVEGIMDIVPFDLSIQVPCNGKMINVNLEDKLKEWRGDGTLDKFFNLV